MGKESNSISNLEAKEELQEKLWNTNFILLLQGQLVSILGDKVYSIALPLWIFAKTGSVVLMSVLMAAAIFPEVVISPFAGTFIDRHDGKKILITSDIISGSTILFIGIASFVGFAQMWMIFIASIIVGICSCFFNPTINSTIPDVVSFLFSAAVESFVKISQIESPCKKINFVEDMKEGMRFINHLEGLKYLLTM